mgnify:CR=1 FL=1
MVLPAVRPALNAGRESRGRGRGERQHDRHRRERRRIQRLHAVQEGLQKARAGRSREHTGKRAAEAEQHSLSHDVLQDPTTSGAEVAERHLRSSRESSRRHATPLIEYSLSPEERNRVRVMVTSLKPMGSVLRDFAASRPKVRAASRPFELGVSADEFYADPAGHLPLRGQRPAVEVRLPFLS